jgi:hypothetical protein
MSSDSSGMPGLVTASSPDESEGNPGYVNQAEGMKNTHIFLTKAADAGTIGEDLDHLVLVEDCYSSDKFQKFCSLYESDVSE